MSQFESQFEYAAIQHDPADPFCAMYDTIRRDVLQVALVAHRTALFRDMTPEQQTQCFIAGAMAAIVGISFAHVVPEGRDMIIEYVKASVEASRKMVELMEKDGVKLGARR